MLIWKQYRVCLLSNFITIMFVLSPLFHGEHTSSLPFSGEDGSGLYKQSTLLLVRTFGVNK